MQRSMIRKLWNGNKHKIWVRHIASGWWLTRSGPSNNKMGCGHASIGAAKTQLRDVVEQRTLDWADFEFINESGEVVTLCGG